MSHSNNPELHSKAAGMVNDLAVAADTARRLDTKDMLDVLNMNDVDRLLAATTQLIQAAGKLASSAAQYQAIRLKQSWKSRFNRMVDDE